MRNDIVEIVKKYTGEERQFLNKTEMARRYNCDARTIDRHIKIADGLIIPKTTKREYTRVVDEFKEIIMNKVDVHGCSAKSVYRFLKTKGYTGKYSTLAAFVREHKDTEIQKATIRFETTVGLQAQVDWKENMTLVNKQGEEFTINIFLMVLGYSRLKYACLTFDRTQDTLFKCMSNAFAYMGGVPQEILFDNMKTVVDKSKSPFSPVVFNEKFMSYTKDAGYKALACMPYRPQTKGKVEALAKLMDNLKVYNEEFESYEDLEEIVNRFRDEINKEVSQSTDEKPIDRFEREKEHLLPLPKESVLASHVAHTKEYTVHKDSMLQYKGKRYSVLTKYIGQKVGVKETTEGKLNIYSNDDIIVTHDISRKRLNYKYEHVHQILKSDALKSKGDDEIDYFIKNNLSTMDTFIGE